MLRKLKFWMRYRANDAPWDTGITPPELVELIEHQQLTSGRALDLGCGTGTNVIYLAQHGWNATGVDFVGRAIHEAKNKARLAGVNQQTTFIAGDVRQLPALLSEDKFNLIVDIGCWHTLPESYWPAYIDSLLYAATGGCIYLLFAFRPTPESMRGIAPTTIEGQLSPYFKMDWCSHGEDTGSQRPASWYQFTRTGVN